MAEHTTEVLVQVMAPVEAAPGSYDWTTVDRIENPASLDIDYLKKEVMKNVIPGNRPPMDILRLVIKKDGVTEMKIMISDFFRKEAQ